MTEREWLTCTDPRRMLDFLLQKGEGSDRKLRLFAVAYCRFLGEKHGAVDVAERFADGLATGAELSKAREEAHEYVWIHCSRGWLGSLFSVQSRAAEDVVSGDAADAARRMIGYAHLPIGTDDSIYQAISVPEPALLRDVFGNPFGTAVVEPNWLTWNEGAVPKIAQEIYEGRAFDSMTILADALQDAGCDDEVILAHLRSEGPHVRGCWVLDLILGQS